jgi:hypothetical protein
MRRRHTIRGGLWGGAIAVTLLVSGCSDRKDRELASQDFVSALCSTDVFQQLLEAHPQVHMTEQELKAQTVGEGLDRVQAFNGQVPTIAEPLVAALRTKPRSWEYLAKKGREVNEQIRKGKLDDKGFQELVHGIAAQAQATCPLRVEAPTPFWADYMIGALLGYFGRLAA